jgi:hypothetical protein
MSTRLTMSGSSTTTKAWKSPSRARRGMLRRLELCGRISVGVVSTADAAASAVGELAGRAGRVVEDGADFVEGN